MSDGEGSIEGRIAALVGRACRLQLGSTDGIVSVDWNDLGEVTLVVIPDWHELHLTATIRLTTEDVTGRDA